MPHDSRILFLIIALIAGGIPTTAWAHKGATGIVKERMDDMEVLAAEMKVLGQMASGRMKYDADRVKDAARKIGSHAVALPAKFPDGSDGHPSQSTPEVWSRRAEFDRLFKELAGYAAALEQAAAGGASSRAAADRIIGDISRNCGACHKVYRMRKK